jgi:YidC/Oxa1 family membrane protein insertase
MERRLLLVFAITFLVLLAAQPLLMRYTKQPERRAPEQKTPPPAAQQAAPPAQPAAPTLPASGASKQATAEAETIIENDLYRIVLTNRGGQAKSWVLKQFKDDRGQALELVNKFGGEKVGLPLSLWTYDEGLRNKLNSVLYLGNESGVQRAPADLVFEYADRDVTVRKKLRFDHSYVVRVEVEVASKGQLVAAYPAWPAGFGDQTVVASYAASQINYLPADQKVVRLSPDRKGEKIAGGGTIRTPFYWGGVVDQYFGAVFLPDNPDSAVLITLRNAVQVPQDANNPESKETVTVEVLGAAAGNSAGITRQRMFVGPKALDVLEGIKASPMQAQGARPNLGELVDFGKYLGFIAKPLFLWLRWTYQHWVANWGWAIVILTVIINVALLPLRLSSMKSALKMQKVQPQVTAIKNRYKGLSMKDPKRAEMNQEISALFKKEKVNPAGGCLPLLIQFPFLIAFYSMLSVAIELRHAQWLWINDLSGPDPRYILPIGIVVSTYLVQKMTPTAGMDPTQQKMMSVMMPVMLGVISWNLASGLGVYWVAGNVIAIVQQWFMNRSAFGREMREHMEKHARKKESRQEPRPARR